MTGIEIHPAARSATGFFIDHGMGVVIGETAEIGDDVTLYQGVTLGGTGLRHRQAPSDRPGQRDDRLRRQAARPDHRRPRRQIGANSVVIHDVPPNSTVVGNPGHPVRIEGRRPEGPDADWIHLPDPVADAIKALSEPDRARSRTRRRTSGGPVEGAGPALRPAAVAEPRGGR